MLRFIQCSFLVLSILMIIACSNKTIQEDNTFYQEQQPEITDHHNIADKEEETIDIQPDQPYTFTHNEQEFEIIPLYKEVLNYISLAREHEDQKEWERIYKQTVLEEFRQNAWGNKNRIVAGDVRTFKPSKNLDKLEEFVDSLSENHKQIVDLISDALITSSEELPLPETKVRVFIVPFNPEEYSLEYGVGGYVYSDGVIVIQLEPESLREYFLLYLVAHEYHHVVLIENFKVNRRAYDLLEEILTEGKADAFAKILYPDVEAPWVKPLNNEEHVWAIMKTVMEPQSTLSIDFFSGNQDMNIPYWSNYKIGYQIMQDFIKNNPDVSIEEWTKMWATEILEKSRFEERFE